MTDPLHAPYSFCGGLLWSFRDLAKSENKGLVVVTHDPKVRDVADRVVGIRDGRLAA